MMNSLGSETDDGQHRTANNRQRRCIPLRRKFFYSLIPLVVTYAASESIMSFLYREGIVEPESIWIQEETGNGPTITFDPIRGFRLSSTPSRMACVVSNGVIESVGKVRGNNYGFPDRDDFETRRQSSKHRRFAVFGDSFSAAQFLSQNWPDHVEDLTRENEKPIQLLNFSVDGGGILNWWSILTRLIDNENFDLDGLIFAVWGDDLSRPFIFLDDRIIRNNQDGQRSIAEGYIDEINPAFWPATVDEALPYFENVEHWRVLSTREFDRVLAQKVRVTLNRDSRFYLWNRCMQGIDLLLDRDAMSSRGSNSHEISDPSQFGSAQKYLMNDFRAFAKTRNIPILVVHVPSREDLLKGTGASSETRSFAKYLDAQFVDGSRAFQNLSHSDIRDNWLPYDYHWNQSGSDRFAQYLVEKLRDWPTPLP